MVAMMFCPLLSFGGAGFLSRELAGAPCTVGLAAFVNSDSALLPMVNVQSYNMGMVRRGCEDDDNGKGVEGQ